MPGTDRPNGMQLYMIAVVDLSLTLSLFLSLSVSLAIKIWPEIRSEPAKVRLFSIQRQGEETGNWPTFICRQGAPTQQKSQALHVISNLLISIESFVVAGLL